MSTTKSILAVGGLMLLLACSRGCPRTADESAPSRAATAASISSQSGTNAPPAKPVAPTRLVSLPVSAYSTSLALEGEYVYLFTHNAVHRLVAGKPAQRIGLELGNGPVLAESGIIFWSKGAIWNASKDGGAVWRLARLSKQPEYFVASNGRFAWLDRADDGLYRVQSLNGQTPRVLVADQDQFSALHMVHDWVFFVKRAKDDSWRIGRVHVARGEPEYTESRTGPTPAMLTGTESVVYYDMERSEIRELTTDLKSESVWLKDFVCSPIYEAKDVFCARFEGLFEVLAASRKPKALSYGRRETITFLRANSKQVVWIADTGPDQLAVDMLPIE
jgi:hypothetical protein